MSPGYPPAGGHFFLKCALFVWNGTLCISLKNICPRLPKLKNGCSSDNHMCLVWLTDGCYLHDCFFNLNNYVLEKDIKKKCE